MGVELSRALVPLPKETRMSLTPMPGIRTARRVVPDGIPYYDFHDDRLGPPRAVSRLLLRAPAKQLNGEMA